MILFVLFVFVFCFVFCFVLFCFLFCFVLFCFILFFVLFCFVLFFVLFFFFEFFFEFFFSVSSAYSFTSVRIGRTQSVAFSHNLGPLETIQIFLIRNGLESLIGNFSSSATSFAWIVPSPASSNCAFRFYWTSGGSLFTNVTGILFSIKV